MSYGYAHPPQQAYPPAPAYQQVRRSAPPSVHMLAFLHYLGGLIQLAAAVAVVVMPSDDLFANDPFLHPDQPAVAAYIIAGGLTIGALISLFIGRSLQRGRQWVRVLLIIFSLIPVALVVARIVLAGEVSSAVGLIGPGLYLLLLNTRAARSWFRRHTW